MFYICHFVYSKAIPSIICLSKFLKLVGKSELFDVVAPLGWQEKELILLALNSQRKSFKHIFIRN